LPTTDGTIDEDTCAVRYDLQVYLQSSTAYVSLSEFQAAFDAANIGGQTITKIDFDVQTGDIKAKIANFEIQALQDTFFVDASVTSSVAYAVQLRIVPVVPGSTRDGPGQIAIRHDVKIKLVAQDLVQECAQNVLTTKELTVLGNEQRDN
jgi:hypothetical protein